ncbi:hypothetical protein R3P38DRAFT_2545648, partial [Favolaschia claudopus]
LYVAYLLHWGLFGTLTIQLYLYYEAFPNDSAYHKRLVYGIYLIELVQTLLVTHDAFAMFGYGFGNVAALTNMHFDWLTVPIMSGLVAFVGQSFYASRIHALSKSRAIPAIILIISFTSTIGGFVAGVFSFQAGDITLLNNRKTSITVGVWCGGSALSDILIAVFMTYYLSKSATGFRQTNILISRLIRLTIETGLITALVALANLVLFFAFPGHTYFGTPALIMPKLYANTILAVLNARFRIVDGRATYVSSADFTEIFVPTQASYVAGSVPRFRHTPVVSITQDLFSREQENVGEDVELEVIKVCMLNSVLSISASYPM